MFLISDPESDRLIMIRLYHISQRFKGTGIFSFGHSKSSIGFASKLDKLVANEVKRTLKRNERKKRHLKKPLSLRFRDHEEKLNFNALMLKNINNLKNSMPELIDVVSKNNVIFTDVRTDSELSELVVFWKSSGPGLCKNAKALDEIQQKLRDTASILCDVLNQTSNLRSGKIPKVVFEQDYKMKSEVFIDLLHNLNVDEEPLENSEIEHSSTNEIYQKYYDDDDETQPPDPSPILWKTNVLNFKRDLVLDQVGTLFLQNILFKKTKAVGSDNYTKIIFKNQKNA